MEYPRGTPRRYPPGAGATRRALGRSLGRVPWAGGNDFGTADCDLRRLSRLAAPGAAVFVANVDPECAGLACDGRTVAWRGAEAEGLVRDASCGRDFCEGRYGVPDLESVFFGREYRVA